MNQQKALPCLNYPDLLQVSEVFHSIQGEGPFAGHSAIFIRLAGCNLQCPECDTKYPVRFTTSVESLVEQVLEIKETLKYLPLVIITGGEPFRQNIGSLVHAIHTEGFSLQIETNGTLCPEAFPWALCTIVCGPKSSINKKILPRIDAFKYVGAAGEFAEDGLPFRTLGMGLGIKSSRPSITTAKPIYLQPMDTSNPFQNQKNLDAVIDRCFTHGYILCLQLHKIIGRE